MSCEVREMHLVEFKLCLPDEPPYEKTEKWKKCKLLCSKLDAAEYLTTRKGKALDAMKKMSGILTYIYIYIYICKHSNQNEAIYDVCGKCLSITLDSGPLQHNQQEHWRLASEVTEAGYQQNVAQTSVRQRWTG